MSEKKFKIDTNVVVDRGVWEKKSAPRECVGISRESPLRVSEELCVVALAFLWSRCQRLLRNAGDEIVR